VFQCELPGAVDETAFEGECRAMIHGAWATRATGERETEAVNLEGSRRLFALARASRVESIVFLSSMTAAEDAPGRYGRDKWRVERMLNSDRDLALRPGLVVGPGGLVGRIRAGLASWRVAPLVYGGRQRLPVVWWEDVCLAVTQVLRRRRGGLLHACAREPVSLRDLFRGLASLDGRRALSLPLPGDAFAGLLALAERCGVRPPVSSENVLSLKRPPRLGIATDLPELGVEPRSWSESLELLRADGRAR
jgi:nucleoside-diphosphate-sugar epimerase